MTKGKAHDSLLTNHCSEDASAAALREFLCITELAATMFGLDQSLFLEWLSAWLVLNWGAHLAFSQSPLDDTSEGSAKRQFPKLSEQFTYLLNALAIAWLIRWSWQLLPPIG